MPPTTASDIHGRRFGKLLVICRAPANTKASKRAHWLCVCDCGTKVVKLGKYLLNGDTNSCGCIQREHRAGGNPKYGASMHTLHPREYTIWRSMKSRCYVRSSSNFKFYGAIGVTVCERWRDDFVQFLNDMGPCPTNYTLDRIDPSGNYEPDNCRWASWDTQWKNKRRHHAAAPSSSLSSTRS